MPRCWPAILALFATAAHAATTQTETVERLPVDYFTHAADLGRVEISPDGQFLAATYEVDGESRLAFLNLAQLGDVKEMIAPRGTAFHDFEWISPVRVLYRLSVQQAGLIEAVTTGELLAIDRDGTHPQYVYGCRYASGEGDPGSGPATKPADGDAADAVPPDAEGNDEKKVATCGTADVLSLVPDDDRHVLVAEHLWLREGSQYRYDPDAATTVAMLDSYDGTEDIIAHLSLRGGKVLADRDHRPRFAVGRNEEDELAVTWQPAPDTRWTTFAFDGFDAKTLTPVELSADGRSALFIGRRVREPRKVLYRLDLERETAVQLYAHPLVDVDAAVENLAGDAVIGVRVDPGKPEHRWLDEDDASAKLYASLERAFPGQTVEITSATADLRQAIALVQSDVNPGDYYLVDAQTRNAQYLRSARSWVDPAKMHHKEPIELKARDGTSLHGYVTRPAGKAPFPLVVLPHGGPYGVRDTWAFDWEAQLLAEYGYAVLQVNYRGSGGYGEHFMHAGFREWGGKMQDDVTDATRWAIANGIAAKDAICIFGTGYGGYAALMGVIRERGLYRCAAAYDGLYDLSLVLARNDPQIAPATRRYLDDILGFEEPELQARSPVHNVDKVDAPLLIMAAGNPSQVEYRHAGLMEAALKSAGKPVETALVEQREEIYKQLLEFLSRHLRATSRGPDTGGVKPAG
jgi:dipeptidyl aminopeptidase/acylaminoacyl peptidase